MLVLGIESSCDETGVALYSETQGLIAHALHSQISTHQQYGGVVPELASRDHVKSIVPLVDLVFKEANVDCSALDAVAYTSGPGLTGALLVGASFAKSLAFSLGIKALGVHHLEAHVLAAQLDNPVLTFPFTTLLVSGGHTQLIAAHALGHYELLGETLDDAVGEAFDKTAKLMGLPYPGGPALAKIAEHCTNELFHFPRPMLDRAGLDFSFSGLKTHALTTWHKTAQDDTARSAIAAAFQAAVVEVLTVKCKRALEYTGHTCLVAAGGVAANRALRCALEDLMKERDGKVYFPSLQYCTDNGAMIAYAGYLHLKAGEYDSTTSIKVFSRCSL